MKKYINLLALECSDGEEIESADLKCKYHTSEALENIACSTWPTGWSSAVGGN